MTLALLALAGCAADRYVPEEDMKPWTDGYSSYKVEDTDSGFKLYVWHEKMQCFKSSAAIEKSGKAAMYNIADEVAEERKRPIEEIVERKVKFNIGRTFWTITSWSAVVNVLWKK